MHHYLLLQLVMKVPAKQDGPLTNSSIRIAHEMLHPTTNRRVVLAWLPQTIPVYWYETGVPATSSMTRTDLIVRVVKFPTLRLSLFGAVLSSGTSMSQCLMHDAAYKRMRAGLAYLVPSLPKMIPR